MADTGSSSLRIQEIAASPGLDDALRFRRALEIETVGVLLFRPTGEITRANGAFLGMCGYTEDDIRSGRLRWTDMTPPEWQAASAEALRQFVSTGAVKPYEKQYFRKDGTRFWVFIASKMLSPDEGIAFVLDVTERKAAEAKLGETQLRLERNDSQLQTITDSVPALIAYVDPKLRYLRVNRAYARFFGMSPDELIGKPMQTVLGKAFANIHHALQMALYGEPQHLDVVLDTVDGEQRDMVSQYIPDISPEGYVLGVVIQSTDMTERRRTEHMLRTAEKLAAVGRLAASMAHEINNPLEAVMNLLFLAKQSVDPETTRIFLEQAEEQLRRVAAITSQTLRFHKQSTRPAPLTATDLFGSVLAIYATRLLNGGVQVQQRLRAEQVFFCFDGEIRQVLSNLVSNALDALVGRRGLLFLRAIDSTDWPTGRPGVRLTVADNGPGMSSIVQARLWEAFFTTKEVGGTGLGLWISRDIVDRHAGRIRVRSNERRGTLFTLWLPLEAATR